MRNKFFPPLDPAADATAHVAYHFNYGSVSSVDLLYRVAFASAKHELLIQNPYMAPDREVLEMLAAAARRGVDVRLMLGGPHTDFASVRHAGHHRFAMLLEQGVRIYEYQPTFNHQKIMVVDGLWSHIASTNLDNRSFESNDEVSLGILDAEVAAELRAAFFTDLGDCVEIHATAWRQRPLRHRLLDRVMSWFNEPL